jgi:predicted aldo/keto reductase-like oxidoreductase
MEDSYNRREFLHRLAALGGAFAVNVGAAEPLMQKAFPAGPLPKRILGRTDVRIPVLGLGLGPLGIANFSPEELQAVVEAAIEDWGSPVLVDVQWNYGQAETHLAPLLKKRRADIFIVTKTWEQDQVKVVASIEESIRRLGIESADAVLLNNIGLFDLDRLFKPGGALAGLQEIRKRGMARHLGLSGHMLTHALVRTLESGEFDLAMFVVNFVDRHTYNFEEKVIPVARKHNVGVAAMKVLGGSASGYERKDQRAKLEASDFEPAIRYALGVPGVCTAVLGCKSIEEMRLAGQVARRYRPMGKEELQSLMKRGEQLAREWGRHLGDV